MLLIQATHRMLSGITSNFSISIAFPHCRHKPNEGLSTSFKRPLQFLLFVFGVPQGRLIHRLVVDGIHPANSSDGVFRERWASSTLCTQQDLRFNLFQLCRPFSPLSSVCLPALSKSDCMVKCRGTKIMRYVSVQY